LIILPAVVTCFGTKRVNRRIKQIPLAVIYPYIIK